MGRLLVLTLLAGLSVSTAACQERPDRAYERGVTAWRDGNFSEAVERLRDISRNHPHSEQAPQALLRAARIQGRDLRLHDDAVATYQLLQAMYPDSPLARQALEDQIATRFRHTEDDVGVIIDAQRYLDQFADAPEAPVMHQFMVRSYLRLHEFDRAREESERFLERFPDHELADEMAYTIIRSLFVGGRNAAAVEEALQQLAQRPGSAFVARTYFLMASALEEMDRLEAALAAFEGAAVAGYPAGEVLQARIDAVTERMARKYD